jgi:hypothetical protein
LLLCGQSGKRDAQSLLSRGVKEEQVVACTDRK